MRKNLYRRACVVIVMSLGTTPAWPVRAESPTPAPAVSTIGPGLAVSDSESAPRTASVPAGFETHDGFYARAQIGGGYLRSSASVPGGHGAWSGGGCSLGLALGHTVAKNLIVYGTFTTTFVSGPTLDVNGMSFSGDSGKFGSAGFGAGVAYYLERANVYFAGSLLLNQLSLVGDGIPAGQSEWGPGFEALVGKEWWVSSNLGLGLAAEALIASNKDKGGGQGIGDGSATWKTTGFALLFSATYN